MECVHGVSVAFAGHLPEERQMRGVGGGPERPAGCQAAVDTATRLAGEYVSDLAADGAHRVKLVAHCHTALEADRLVQFDNAVGTHTVKD